MLEINGLVKKFGGVMATNDVSMSFAEGSLSAVIGPNGAGKTTLFNQITGHLLPDQGEILLNGENLVGLKPREIVAKGLGRAFQVASIFPTFSVLDALMSSVSAHEMKSEKLFQPFDNKVVRERAEQLLAVLGLESVGHVASSKISHGDQKVLDIGLALALKPRVLLLDERTAGMGPDERWQMVRTVQRLWEDNNLTLIFIEHDMDIVQNYSERVIAFYQGEIIADDNCDKVLKDKNVQEYVTGKTQVKAK